MPDPTTQHDILHMLYLSTHCLLLVVVIQNQVPLVGIVEMAMVALLSQL